ncbi:MAG: hypothetical protein IID41_10650 [Planctomycetes bacterium]|nr:hypothetical protein [Planctomycetota bacterium]
MRRIGFKSSGVILLLSAGMLLAQSLGGGPDDLPQELQILDRELAAKTQQLGDWSEQYQIVSDVIHNVWSQNNWKTEADLFARDTALQIQQVPPWKLEDRMDLLVEAAGQRYHLDEQQSTRFQNQMYGEMWKMAIKYGPTLMNNAREMLETRLRKEPFTADQVARWANAFDPLMQGFQADVSRMADEFGHMLTPEQRTVFDRDLQSVNKRMAHFASRTEAWKKGEWRIEDWGLQDDPIHLPVYKKRLAVEAIDRLLNRRVRPQDEDSWRRYVRGFVTLYDLDGVQKQVCSSILEDLLARARRYRVLKGQEIRQLTLQQRRDHALLEPIREMFSELKSRLSRIPMERQYKRALAQAPVRPKSTRRPRNPRNTGR